MSFNLMIFSEALLASRQRNLAAILFLLGLIQGTIVFLHFTPGALSFDSMSILAQARSGVFQDGQPPLMALIWRLIDYCIPGAIGMLLLNLFLFYGGVFLILLWTIPRYGNNTIIASMIIGLFPPIIGIIGAIWIDITMAGFFLTSIGIFLVGCCRQRVSSRGTILFTVFIVISLGIAIRHNGAAGAFPLITVFLFKAIYVKGRLIKRFAKALLSGLFLVVVIFVGTKQLSSMIVDVNNHYWRIGALYQIAGTSCEENKDLFYSDIIKEMTLDNMCNLYSPRSHFSLFTGKEMQGEDGGNSIRIRPIELNKENANLNHQLLSNWLNVIIDHPISFLAHRYSFFKSLLTRSTGPLWGPVYDYVIPNDLNIPERIAHDSFYFTYIKKLASESFVFLPLLYLILSGALFIPALVYGLRFDSTVFMLISALYASGLAHMVGVFCFAVSPDFRYSHWMITTTVLASMLLILEFIHIKWLPSAKGL